jgi:hypothetical protein
LLDGLTDTRLGSSEGGEKTSRLKCGPVRIGFPGNTHPPYLLQSAFASSRVMDSSSPVKTNVNPARQFSAPWGIGLDPVGHKIQRNGWQTALEEISRV